MVISLELFFRLLWGEVDESLPFCLPSEQSLLVCNLLLASLSHILRHTVYCAIGQERAVDNNLYYVIEDRTNRMQVGQARANISPSATPSLNARYENSIIIATHSVFGPSSFSAAQRHTHSATSSTHNRTILAVPDRCCTPVVLSVSANSRMRKRWMGVVCFTLTTEKPHVGTKP